MIDARFTPPFRLRPGASLAFLVSVALLITALHAVNLTADSPDGFAADDIGLRVDEGYKTLAPRNLALFGSVKWSEADEYDGWFSGSPLTQSLMYLSFSVAEPSVGVARATALIYFLCLVVIVLLAHRGFLSNASLLMLAALLAAEPFLFFFSRVALFEVALAAFVALAFLLLRRFGYGHAWLPLAIVIAVTVAAFVLIKISAVLYFLPAMAALAFFAAWHSNPKVALPVLLATFAVLLVLLLSTHEVWVRRLDLQALASLPSRVLTDPLSALSPWVTALAWFCIADSIRISGRKLIDDPYFLAVAATVVGVPVLLGLLSYAPPRYFVAVMPAQILAIGFWLGAARSAGVSEGLHWTAKLVSVALLSVAVFAVLWAVANAVLPLTPLPQGETAGISGPGAIRLLFPIAVALALLLVFAGWRGPSRSGLLPRAGVQALLVVAVVSGLYQASEVWMEPSYSSHEIRERLADVVEPGEATAGDWAPFFALGTRLPAIYSSSGWNRGKVILELCPTFFVHSGTRHDDAVVESYAVVAGVTVEDLQILGAYAGNLVVLKRLHYPDGECE
ncbi:hypothetical protein M0534_10805 [Methylonatrum kenyense]|uniref:hypothetical protein n=1 Tax=Methylonatrum kenyense TaxID=455253 RepID=UPI0020C00988|nr:hypothetical protein [Methylonatrum kenyense]MCK8516806.1 hypothetical protein [Methylonatrum kenyense]